MKKPLFQTRVEVISWICGKLQCSLYEAERLLYSVEQNHKTLRDEFATAALSRLNCDRWTPQELAEKAYELADAMIRERNKETT